MPMPQNQMSTLMKKEEQSIPVGGYWGENLFGPILVNLGVCWTKPATNSFKFNSHANRSVPRRNLDVSFGVVPVGHEEPPPNLQPSQPYVGVLMFESLNGVRSVVYRAANGGFLYREWTINGTTFKKVVGY